MVRHALDSVVSNFKLYQSFKGTDAAPSFLGIFDKGILFFAGLIILMATGCEVSSYFVRQTLIVMSRLINTI